MTANGITVDGTGKRWFTMAGAVDTASSTQSGTDTSSSTSSSTGSSSVGSSTSTGAGTTATGATSEFSTFLKSVLSTGDGTNVSEEELFAGVVEERLKALKGEDVAKKYHDALQTQKSALMKPDGFVPWEDAAKNALKSLREDKTLSTEEADKVYSQAFAASQLDSNTETLWDSRGGAGDPTKAVEEIAAAILRAQTTVDNIGKGTEVATRSLDEATAGKAGATTSGSSVGGSTTGSGSGSSVGSGISTDTVTANGTTIDGANGFLFKPVSNNESKLAVLLPGNFKNFVAGVKLKDSLGNVLDTGRSTGYGDTGEREKFAFSKAGGEYPANLNVEVTFLDGTTKTYVIPDPSQRYD